MADLYMESPGTYGIPLVSTMIRVSRPHDSVEMNFSQIRLQQTGEWKRFIKNLNRKKYFAQLKQNLMKEV